ncbi:UNVERIFIED_CONTAM: transcriptional regulator [Euhalothece sp. KZN 001]
MILGGFNLSSSVGLARSSSLYQQAYQTLRQRILNGEFSPEQRLVETQLAEELQVSRTPIRESLRQLQRENLITTDHKGGLIIPRLSPEDARQLYDCRLALELLAVQEACYLGTAEQLKNVGAWVIRAETLLAIEDASEVTRSELLEIDYSFHRAIAQSSGNDHLLELLVRVFDQMTLLRVQTTEKKPDVLEIRSEHRKIYEALLSRDVSVAQAAIKDHLEASKDRVASLLQ